MGLRVEQLLEAELALRKLTGPKAAVARAVGGRVVNEDSLRVGHLILFRLFSLLFHNLELSSCQKSSQMLLYYYGCFLPPLL